MTYTPTLPVEMKSLFADAKLAFFIFAVVFRLMAIGVSIRLLMQHTPLFNKFFPNEIQKPFKQLSKQQQYRYICSICLFSTLVVHLIYVILDMVVISPDTPLSYKMGQINITMIICDLFGFAYHISLWSALLWLILAEIDRYNRLTLVVPGSLRARLVQFAGQFVKLCTVLVFFSYWITLALRISEEATQSNILSTETMNLVAAIRDGFAAGLTAYQTVLEFYLNLSMVKYVLFKGNSKASRITTQTATVRTRILGFLVCVLMAHLIAINLILIGRIIGPFHPLVLFAISAVAVAVSTSFSLTDTLLNCLHESRQENEMEKRQIDITGYKKGTDVYEEGLLLSEGVGPTLTQLHSVSQKITPSKQSSTVVSRW